MDSGSGSTDTDEELPRATGKGCTGLASSYQRLKHLLSLESEYVR